MIRGTTPTHTFTLPFSTDLLEKAYIIYRQELYSGDTIVIEKGKDADANLDSCEFNGDKIIVKLTQEETFKFVHGIIVEIQVIVKTKDGLKPVSNIFEVSVDEILKDDVI